MLPAFFNCYKIETGMYAIDPDIGLSLDFLWVEESRLANKPSALIDLLHCVNLDF